MNNSKWILRMILLSVLTAIGVVISPILRFEGMCPMAHFINVVCSVLLGPWYSLLCAVLIGIIRMTVMSIPPLALTGAVFGAFLSGVFYRLSRGSILCAVLGEIIGTGVIGAVVSYPVMTLLWGKEGIGLFFYVPSFICGTLIGGSIALVFLKKLSGSGILNKFQNMLASESYADRSSTVGDAASIASVGVIVFISAEILCNALDIYSPLRYFTSYSLLAAFLAASIFYIIARKTKGADIK